MQTDTWEAKPFLQTSPSFRKMQWGWQEANIGRGAFVANTTEVTSDLSVAAHACPLSTEPVHSLPPFPRGLDAETCCYCCWSLQKEVNALQRLFKPLSGSWVSMHGSCPGGLECLRIYYWLSRPHSENNLEGKCAARATTIDRTSWRNQPCSTTEKNTFFINHDFVWNYDCCLLNSIYHGISYPWSFIPSDSQF